MWYWIGISIVSAILVIPAVQLARALWRNNVAEPVTEAIQNAVHVKLDAIHDDLGAMHTELVSIRNDLVEHMAGEEDHLDKIDRIDDRVDSIDKRVNDLFFLMDTQLRIRRGR